MASTKSSSKSSGGSADSNIVGGKAAVEEPQKIGPVDHPGAVKVDSVSKRDDSDVLLYHFATITKGDNAGQKGVYIATESVGGDGFPKDVVLELRGERGGERLTVPYKDIVPAEPGR